MPPIAGHDGVLTHPGPGQTDEGGAVEIERVIEVVKMKAPELRRARLAPARIADLLREEAERHAVVRLRQDRRDRRVRRNAHFARRREARPQEPAHAACDDRTQARPALRRRHVSRGVDEKPEPVKIDHA